MNRASRPGAEYRVRFRRCWADRDQYRVFQTRAGMRRYVEKLLGDGRPDLEPVVELEVLIREVGSWWPCVDALTRQSPGGGTGALSNKRTDTAVSVPISRFSSGVEVRRRGK